MYTHGHPMYIRERIMALHIANPVVVAKVERVARATGLTKTAVVEQAVDHLARSSGRPDDSAPLGALLGQLDRIPDRPDAHDPLEWDEHGLPR